MFFTSVVVLQSVQQQKPLNTRITSHSRVVSTLLQGHTERGHTRQREARREKQRHTSTGAMPPEEARHELVRQNLKSELWSLLFANQFTHVLLLEIVLAVFLLQFGSDSLLWNRCVAGVLLNTKDVKRTLVWWNLRVSVESNVFLNGVLIPVSWIF